MQDGHSILQIKSPSSRKCDKLHRWELLLNAYALTNDNGKVLVTYHYSAYGEVNIEGPNGNTLTESAYAYTYFYTGCLLEKNRPFLFQKSLLYSTDFILHIILGRKSLEIIGKKGIEFLIKNGVLEKSNDRGNLYSLPTRYNLDLPMVKGGQKASSAFVEGVRDRINPMLEEERKEKGLGRMIRLENYVMASSVLDRSKYHQK